MDYKVKIAKVEKVDRTDEPTKRMKATEEYNGEPLRVLGVPFGGHMEGRDSDGEAFYDKTDIGLRIGDERPVTYYHGFGPDDMDSTQNPPAVIGMAEYAGKDERGHWFMVRLDETEELAQRVIQADEAKASSGAVSHLVRYGKAGLINVWPIGELALFDTNEWRRPANELAVVERANAEEVAENEPEDVKTVKATLDEPEDMQTETETENLQMENVMSDETKNQDVVEEQAKEQPAYVTKEQVEEMVKAANPITSKGAPSVIIKRSGRDETRGFLEYVRTGKENEAMKSSKASNDTSMNITTNVDGQYLVPTGFYQGVIARKDEMAVAPKVGVTEIPGIGTTVDVPYDNEADGEFIVTTESAEFDDDAPATDKKSMTLKKYTKTITITHELLRDEDAKLESFLMEWVARGMAKTHNDLLITEVETYGTSLKTFASATAVAAGELEAMVYGADIAAYLEGGNIAWVMSGPSYSKIASLTGDPRVYVETPQGSGGMRPGLIGFPVHFTNKADTIAASKKSVFFGDWASVGVRNGNGLQIIRDPYTRAKYGELQLHFLFDCVYGVLNAEAIGYGVHPSA